MNLFNIAKSFEMKAAKGWPEIYLCVDLHGTIIPSGRTTHDKEDKLEFYPGAQEVLQWFSSRKDIFIILWTSTPPDRIGRVLDWFKENRINIDFVNKNPHAKDTPRSSFKDKPYFNILLDDRGGFEADKDWLAIKEELIRLGQWWPDFRNVAVSETLVVN